MKALLVAGLVVLILGIIYVVPFSHAEHRALRAGNTHVGLTTEHRQRVSPATSVLLVVVGAGIMIAGKRST
jgi:hypothetical protein